MTINQEIERKFLINDFSWLTVNLDYYIIHQYYISQTPDLEERVRFYFSKSGVCLYAVHTKKSNSSSLIRNEEEFKISIPNACLLITNATSIVRKKRYTIIINNHKIEVDQFIDENLWLAEIELSSTSQQLNLPDWIGREVTNNKMYYNKNIAVLLED